MRGEDRDIHVVHVCGWGNGWMYQRSQGCISSRGESRICQLWRLLLLTLLRFDYHLAIWHTNSWRFGKIKFASHEICGGKVFHQHWNLWAHPRKHSRSHKIAWRHKMKLWASDCPMFCHSSLAEPFLWILACGSFQLRWKIQCHWKSWWNQWSSWTILWLMAWRCSSSIAT